MKAILYASIVRFKVSLASENLEICLNPVSMLPTI